MAQEIHQELERAMPDVDWRAARWTSAFEVDAQVDVFE
jgi:hypothetical protein